MIPYEDTPIDNAVLFARIDTLIDGHCALQNRLSKMEEDLECLMLVLEDGLMGADYMKGQIKDILSGQKVWPEEVIKAYLDLIEKRTYDENHG